MQSLLFPVLQIAALVAQTIFGGLFKTWVGPFWHSPYFWLFLLATIASGVFAYWQKRLLDAQHVKYKVLMDNQLEPLVRLLIMMASRNLTDRKKELKNFIKTATNMAIGITPSPEVRASVFRIVNDPKTGFRMEPMQGTEAGRADRPQSTFYKDRGEGMQVWANMTGSGYTFCSNTSKKKQLPAGWNSERERSYKSFISVSIEGDGKLYGMLTVNTPKSRTFSREDVNSMQVVAGLIATALALCNTGISHYYVLS